MTPCSLCYAHHSSDVDCDGRWLDDDYGPSCLRCEDPVCEDQIACAACRAEAIAALPIILPALAQCMRLRVGKRNVRTVVAAAVSEAIDDAFDFADMSAAAYRAASRVGAIAALGISLGGLAVLSPMLGA
jgi:hypothetical protein